VNENGDLSMMPPKDKPTIHKAKPKGVQRAEDAKNYYIRRGGQLQLADGNVETSWLYSV
jgi:hypothetical protein